MSKVYKSLSSRKNILKNKYIKVFFLSLILIFILTILNPIRKLVVYKTTNVFEDKPLGYYFHQYNDSDQFEITNLQPSDIVPEDFVYEKIRYNKYGNIIKWTLKADEYFRGHTDVLGICRYHFYVYPNDNVQSSIEIDHQGGACKFWENVKQGDTIDVIGEVITSKSNWTEAGRLKKYATKYVIEVRPMIIRHHDKYYINASLPASIRTELFKII